MRRASQTITEKNLEIAREYLRAVEQGATGDSLSRFFSSDVVHELFPNRFAPRGARLSLPEMLASAERGKQVMAKQRYEIKNVVAEGDQVALEVLWTGTLAVPFDTLGAGAKMRAHFAVFLRFRDARIISQNNYDCVEPW